MGPRAAQLAELQAVTLALDGLADIQPICIFFFFLKTLGPQPRNCPIQGKEFWESLASQPKYKQGHTYLYIC